jgi:hypothetical protein
LRRFRPAIFAAVVGSSLIRGATGASSKAVDSRRRAALVVVALAVRDKTRSAIVKVTALSRYL